eukprot:115442-Pleurochrysis_carterae.AAC.1
MATASPDEETGHSSAESPPEGDRSMCAAERTSTGAEVGAPRDDDARGGRQVGESRSPMDALGDDSSD